ncbi:hypothetical protein [Streptomyces sp. NPDC005805]|uniref:hypothetical protein n=1 Tax=Streptomyces sp. NPDC005805 TaxID=3157068 RepID=UPI0033FF60B4
MLDLSPFAHLPQLPGAADPSWTGAGALLLLAGALVAAGLAGRRRDRGLRRRDLRT